MSTTPLLPLFLQQAGSLRSRLCATLRTAIAQGHLRYQHKLPSSRQLASDLGISRVTVEAAYAQLESEGYLSRSSGRGTFVAIEMAPVSRGAPVAPRRQFSQRGTVLLRGNGCDDPPFPQAFAAGSPDLRAFPHAIWQRISQRTQRQLGQKAMGYGDPLGYWPLRQAVADYLALSRGMQCEASQVMILTSSQQALQLLALLLLDAGDEVGMEEPGYAGARQAFIAAGAQCRALPPDSEGAQLTANSARLVYLTPGHHYPYGTAMSLARRLQWLAWAKAQQSWIIEDDYDSEFHYDDKPGPALQSLDRTGRVITLGTFSKTLFPSLRLAWMVLPSGLIEACGRVRSIMDGHSALLPQAITAEFLLQGHFASHLRLMRQLYHSRRDLLRTRLQQELAPWLKVMPSPGGLQLTATLNHGNEAQLTQLAQGLGLTLPRLSPLFGGDATQQGWILGFAALTPDEIIAGCRKLVTLFSHYGQNAR